MYSLKRQAPEPILPSRSSKHRRLSLETVRPGCSQPRPLSTRWLHFGKDFTSLMSDTLVSLASLIPVPITPLDESGMSSADEATFSSSPPSSSMVSTPRQTPSPPRRSGNDCEVDEQSTPTQTFDNPIPSPPRPRLTNAKIWTPDQPALSEDSFKMFEQAHFSTPKAPLTSSSPSNWTSPNDSSPDRVLKTTVLPSMQKLELENSSKSSQTPDNSLSSDSRLEDTSGNRTKSGLLLSRKKKQHIFIKAHKTRVRLETMKQQKEFRERYKKSQIQGYKSSAEDFKEYLDYQFAIAPHVAPTSVRPNTGLFGTKIESRGGHLFEKGRPDEFFERVVEKARATLNEPQAPKPNIPSIEELQERRRAKDQAIERLLRRPPLPTALTPDEEKQVNALLHKSGVIAKFAREQVYHQDISRLQPRQWLNDEIINFYGAMILARSEESKENPGAVPSIKDKGKAKKHKAPLNVHYFSSFFWEKYTQEGYEKGRLAKWTKKVDVFSKDAILIPVNHGNAHWTAASINFRLKRIESYDSMRMADEKVCKVLRQYLNEEHMNKKKKPFNFDGWQDWYPSTTPQQENAFDCGVFTCQFLESLSRGEDFFNFAQQNMPYLRKRMIWEIGNTKFYDAH